MLNRKGFGKYETITVMLIILIWSAMAGHLILQAAEKRKYSTMRGSAASFARVVLTDNSSSSHEEVIYLKEAIDEQLLSNIKNPFGNGSCDTTQSKVISDDGIAYTTLKCGDYLIDGASFNDIENVGIIKVSDWSLKKIKGFHNEKRELYNCTLDDKELFEEYYEELYFVYEYNKKFNKAYHSISEIKDGSCKVVSKTFYRSYVGIEEE